MMKLFAIWIFKPVVIVLWLIHSGAAYAQGRRRSMGCNPTVDGGFNPNSEAGMGSARVSRASSGVAPELWSFTISNISAG